MFELNSRTIFLIASIGIVLFLLMNKQSVIVRERYEDKSSTNSNDSTPSSSVAKTESTQPIKVSKVSPKENKAPMKGASVSDSTILNPNVEVNEMTAYPGPFEGCLPKHKELTPEDLLPRDMNSKWAQVNPAGQGMLMDRNFLDAAHHVGINTVGQSLRNANYNIRSEIPNPQKKVSPWLQSTIDPDVGRKPLEIGSGW